MNNFPVMDGMVHSLKEVRPIRILKKIGDNSYMVYLMTLCKYCHAIYNPFTGLYYCDDLYAEYGIETVKKWLPADEYADWLLFK